MLDLFKLRLASAAALALTVAGCSDSEQEATPASISENAELVKLVDKARKRMSQGKLAEAGGLYDEAIALEGENPAIWVDVARLRYRGGEHFSALEASDYALELGPEYGPALHLKAQLVRDAHGLKASLPWFESAANADPENAELLSDYAATLGDLGRNAEMLAKLREINAFAPRYPMGLYLRAVLAARAEKPVLARSLLAKSGLYQREVPAALLLDALVDIQQGSYDTAVPTLEKLIKRQPSNVRANELLARALWLNGRDKELVAGFAARAEAADATPYLTMLVGRAYERMGERERAAPLIERAWSLNEVQAVALDTLPSGNSPTGRMRSLVKAGNTGDGVQLGARLRRELPLSSDILALSGDAAFAAGNAQGALELYGRAAKVRRSWPTTRKVIAAYRKYGDDFAADTVLARTLAGEPRNTEALLMLAERRAVAKDWRRVAILLDQAIALGAGNDPKILDLRAEAAQQLDNAEDASRFDAMAEWVRPSALLRSE